MRRSDSKILPNTLSVKQGFTRESSRLRFEVLHDRAGLENHHDRQGEALKKPAAEATKA